MYSSSSSSTSQSSSHHFYPPSDTNPNSNDNRQLPYGFPLGVAGSSLARQGSGSSSAAGFLNQLATTAAAASASHDNGFSITRGKATNTDTSHGIVSRLNSQLNFSYQEANVSNSNMFKRANSLDTMKSQFQFGVPESALEAATMEKLLHIPQDSVACKIRAKRGFATHPRSIAERERRTRISGKLKKLQDLVPNMDKQTSYSDMLDLAVQHIKCLQDQVQKLNEEMESCTCGCIKKDGRSH